MKRLENINGNIFEPVFNNGNDEEMITYTQMELMSIKCKFAS